MADLSYQPGFTFGGGAFHRSKLAPSHLHPHPSISETFSHPRNRRPRTSFPFLEDVRHGGCPLRKTIGMSTASHVLRRRIDGISNAEKVIDAMLLIAASRIRYSSHAALSMRPFAERLQQMMCLLVDKIRADGRDIETVAAEVRQQAFGILGGTTVLDNLAQKELLDRMYVALFDSNEAEGSTLVVIVSGDKGFCGGYNKSVILKATKRIAELERSLPKKRVELFCIGSQAATYFAKHRPDLVMRGTSLVGKVTEAMDTSTHVCDELLSSFIAADVDRVEFVYTRFVSILANQASVRTLLPVSPSGIESLGDEIFQLTSRNGQLSTIASSRTSPKVGSKAIDYVDTDQDPILLLNALLPMYVNIQILRMVREGMAAELACRLSAMRAAKENAESIQDRLKVKYNRERQAAITTQIVELMSNSNSMPGIIGP